MSELPYSLEQPWFMDQCKIRVGSTVYDVFKWTAPVRVVRFRATLDGHLVGERPKMLTLIRYLQSLQPAAKKPGPP